MAFAPAPPPFNFAFPARKIRKNGKRRGEGSRARRTRAPERKTTESNRDAEYRTGMHAVRAKSVRMLAKIGSSVF